MDVRAVLLAICVSIAPERAQAQATPIAPVATLTARRAQAMAMAGSGIWLVRSTPTVMRSAEDGLRQDPTFLYLTGLPNAIGAVLAIDVTKRETWLFVPDAGRLPGFAALMHAPHAYVAQGAVTAAELGLDHVVSWREFAAFLDRRISEEPGVIVRGPFANGGASFRPAVIAGVDADGLWEQSLRSRWPALQLAEAPDAEDLRAIKDADEVTRLRAVAHSSAAALIDGMRGLRPGRRQREAWDMFVRAYDAALAEMRPGKTASEIFEVWRSDMAKRRPRLRSAFARKVADAALSADGGRFWEIHGVGLASAEGNVDTLRTGQVVAFEPMLTVDGVGLYLEDMVLITATGAEVLTAGLPYSAAEIETVMRGVAVRRSTRGRAK